MRRAPISTRTVVTAVVLSLAATAARVSAAGKIDPTLLAALRNGTTSSFMVLFRDRADLAAAAGVSDPAARGHAVYAALTRTADASQATARARLAARGVRHRAFFIVNAMQVTGDLATAQELASLPGVDTIRAERIFELPDAMPGREQPRVNMVEWNIARIGADAVWTDFGITGQGIVVGTIDTGVEFTHPALVSNYRGNLGGGAFDHNYNWWDPAGVCGPPGSAPCDNVGHGTHTMGTAVGGDGPGPFSNDIGVAPGAHWITAKGCESYSCSESALLSAGQFMLAPTDLFGNNPDPSRRPHVVSNSWGSFPGDGFFQAMVQAWRAAGIFPVFANGNSGPACGTAISPGDYPESFGVGATDLNDVIAFFSSRGPSVFGPLKPDVSAPGVDVRSSVPGGTYDTYSGTSMATPHVAGLVALLWSANTALVRDVDATAAAIRSTATDRLDGSCGGDPDGDPNDVYGEGRIDALTACEAFCGPHGTLTGVVADAATSLPIAGASVSARRQDDGFTVGGTTSASGVYQMSVPVDPAPGPEPYDVTASAFGYAPMTAAVPITQDTVTAQDFALAAVPRFTIRGTIREVATSAPLEGITIRLPGTPILPVLSDAAGGYAIPGVPVGEYDIEVSSGTCFDVQRRHIVVDGDETVDVALTARSDAYGYRCRVVPIDWVEADTVLPLFGDFASTPASMPFRFPFYGQLYGSAAGAFVNVSTKGLLSFTAPSSSDYYNRPLPDIFPPNAALYPFWDDLVVFYGAAVKTAVTGTRPNRRFVVEYQNVQFYYEGSQVTFEVVLYERTGDIVFQYLHMPGSGDGRSATIGIENATGTDALQYSFNSPVVEDGFAIHFIAPPSDIDGDGVLDADDNCPFTPNADQADRDGDGVGDVCDDCPDAADPGQGDADGDQLGDACDPCPQSSDCDADGYNDRIELTLGSDPLNALSIPEADDDPRGSVLGSCLDRFDDDLDHLHDFSPVSALRDPGCDGDGNGVLDDAHQVITTKRFKVAPVLIHSATGSGGRLPRIRMKVRNPLGTSPSPTLGLPAGQAEQVVVTASARLVDPALPCSVRFVDDPLTGEREDLAARSLVLRPGGFAKLTWLAQITCPPGLAVARTNNAFLAQVRVHDVGGPPELLDMIRTGFANVFVR